MHRELKDADSLVDVSCVAFGNVRSQRLGYDPMMRAAVLVMVLGFGVVRTQAFERMLDATSLARAIDIGHTRIEAERKQFHAPYRIGVSRAPIDYVDVITPFRRIAIAADARTHAGNHLFGQREALDTLGATPEQIELRIELTFPPMNTFIGVPGYTVALIPAGGGTPVALKDVSRVPRYGLRVDGMPLPYAYPTGAPTSQKSEPMLGGTIVVLIDGRLLDQAGRYDLTIADGPMTLARSRIDFGALR